MLKAIESQYHDKDKPTIDSFLGLLKTHQNFCLSPEEEDRATYIIAEDEMCGVYGGAVLYPQKISSSLKLVLEDTYEEILGKMFSAFQPKGQEYWTARTGLWIEQDSSFPILETVKLCRNFYKNLYKEFKKFGEKKEVEYLSLTLPTADTLIKSNLSTIAYKNWPYLIEVRPKKNLAGFFHGILSLKENKFKLRMRQLDFLDSCPSTGTYSEGRAR